MNVNLKKQSEQGISFIEILLVVALFSIIAAGAIPFASGFLTRNNLKNKTNEVVSSLREAQINSISSKEDSRWGVNITSNEIIMFKGESYATRDSFFDQSFSIPSTVNITEAEIVFDKYSGNTAQQTINISGSSGDMNIVEVNELGIVDVN